MAEAKIAPSTSMWAKGPLTAEALEKRRAYHRAWTSRYRQNPEIRRRDSLKTRQWQKRNPLKYALNQYKTSARHKGLDYALSDELAITLITAACHYCGALPKPINGIDRVENSIGYIASNAIAACAVCNYAKRTMTATEFIEWIGRAARHLGLTGRDKPPD